MQISGIELSGLRDFADNLKDRLGGGAVLTIAIDGKKLSTVCSISKQLTKQLKAGELLKAVLEVMGGRGGGRPDFAQGGGGDPAKIDQAIESFYNLVEEKLAAS
jgi:alanyl-tRNA synthetase